MKRGVFLILALAALAHAALWAFLHAPVDAPQWSGGPVGGLSYSPYRRDQDPRRGDRPDRAAVERDLDLLRERTHALRTYSVTGGQREIVSLAAERGYILTPGAWIGADPVRNRREIDALISVARHYRPVRRVLVGNEALLRGDIRPSDLIATLRRVRGRIDVPVGTAEPWHVWRDNPELVAAVDFIGVQILPYWEGVEVEKAVGYVFRRLGELRAAYPGKPIVLTETGWPSAGPTRGGARASRVDQARFLREFVTTAANRQLDYFLIEAFDQPWKTSLEGRPGAYWGLFDAARNAKFTWTGPLVERDGWALWAALAVLIGSAPAFAYAARRRRLQRAGAVLAAVLPQALGAMIVCLLIGGAERYLSGPEMAMGLILSAATVFLFIGVFNDLTEAVDLIWTGPLQRKFSRAVPSAALPKVSIHLAVRSEPPDMVLRTLRALDALDYPDFEVIVVDNNTDDETLWRPVEAACKRLDARFRFLHRARLPGNKGGALNLALAHSAPDAEIIAVVDSDYEVDRNWLRDLTPHFENPRIGLVQAPQDYRDQRESRFKELCYWEYAGFFRIGMVRRNEADAIIQHGTMTLIRRRALAGAGGWAQWCITEDAELGLRLAQRGWQSAYIARSYGRGLMPDSLAAYKAQRFRWAYGAMQILKRRWPWLIGGVRARLSPAQRLHYLIGWMPWLADAAGLVFTLGAIAWTAAIVVRPEYSAPPAVFLWPVLTAFAFRQWRLMALYSHAVPCGTRQRWGAALAGLALSHTAAKAVIFGLITCKRPFRRTPKHRDEPGFGNAIAMAAEEAGVLTLLIAAAAAFALGQAPLMTEDLLWIAVLAVMGLPYAATLAVALINAGSKRARYRVALGGAAPPVPAYPPTERRRKRRE